MMKKIGLLFLLLFMAVQVSVAQAEDYVAMVMDVENKDVQFTDGGPVEVMAFLEEHDVLQVQKGAKVIILFFESSIREEISGPATITIGVNGSVSSGGRSTKIRKQTVEYLPPKAEMSKSHHQNFGNIAFRALGTPKAGETQLVITSISNSVYVPHARPILAWKAYPKAKEFVLTVVGEHGSETFTTKASHIMMSTDVQVPGRYTWQLEAKHQGQTVATREGWYTIMSKDSYKSMEKTRQMIQDEYPAGSMQEMAVLSMLYQSYEMWNEMALLLLALNEKQPENAEVIRKIRSINPFLLEDLGI